MTAPTTYTLVGAGGTGSILFPSLIRYLDTYHRGQKSEYYLQVIDGDELETHNFDRQIFDRMAVGKNKAAALVEGNPYPPQHGKLFVIPDYLGKGNINKLVQNNDVILIAVDNYSVRALIEDRVKTLDNAAVINGGNEMTNGSCQLYIRVAGQNKTPPISHFHDEIKYKSADDRAAMSCEARAKIPGGEQTIIANMMSATLVLNMLRIYHAATDAKPPVGHEVHFDLQTLAMRHEDLRDTDGWN